MNAKIQCWMGSAVKEVIWKAILKFTKVDGNIEFVPGELANLFYRMPRFQSESREL